jgi:hypothetical protein
LPALEPVRLDWEQLRASIRYSEPLPDRLSMEGRRISGTTGTDTGPLFEVARGELHFRPNGPDIDFALSAIGVWVAPRVLEGAELPPLDAEADISFGGGVAFVDGFAGSLRGMRGTIRTLRLASGTDMSVSASGTFSVGADGAVEAELSVTIVDAARIGEVLAAIVPERADAILNVSAGIAFFGERAEFPLTVKSGRAYLGPFEIGRVAPLP